MDEITIREHAGWGDEATSAFIDREGSVRDPAWPWRRVRVTLIAERGGEVLGVAEGACGAGVAHLSELLVTRRERNKGIGARLLAAFEAWAGRQGAHKMTLNTEQHRLAVQFYERHGWQIETVHHNHHQHQTVVGMRKVPPADA